MAGSGRTVNSAAANGVKELTLCDTRDRVAGPPSSASAEGGLRRGKQGPALRIEAFAGHPLSLIKCSARACPSRAVRGAKAPRY